jgi:hypothetical protein
MGSSITNEFPKLSDSSTTYIIEYTLAFQIAICDLTELVENIGIYRLTLSFL